MIPLGDLPAGDYRGDEGPVNEVDGGDFCGTELHFVVQETPTTGFGSPGLRAWAVQAPVDPGSSAVPAFASDCLREISIVTLDYSVGVSPRSFSVG